MACEADIGARAEARRRIQSAKQSAHAVRELTLQTLQRLRRSRALLDHGATPCVKVEDGHHAGEFAVRDNNLQVVESGKFGEEKLEADDLPEPSTGRGDVAYALRAKQKNHQAGGDIGQSALHREPYGD